MPVTNLSDLYQLNPTEELPVSAFMAYGDLLPIPACRNNFNIWLRGLSAKYGRMNTIHAGPCLQRGINLVYSQLEAIKDSQHHEAKHAFGFDVLSITEEPLWLQLTEALQEYFPELIKVIKPGRVPAEAIRDKCINRTFYNFVFQKRQIIQEIRMDLINQGELGRLKIKILEAQIAAFHNTYSRRTQFNEQMWRALNSYQHKKVPLFGKGANAKRAGPTSAANASFDIDMSAELFSGLKVEVEKSWDFSKVQHQFKGTAFGGVKTKATGKIFAKFGRGGAKKSYAPESLTKTQRTNFTPEELNSRKQCQPTQLIPGIDIGVNVELAAIAGVQVKVKHEMTVGQIMSMTNEAELFVGAQVKAYGVGHISSTNMAGSDEVIVGKLGGAAFAGLSLQGSSSVTFQARGINAASAKVAGSLDLGIGAKGEIEAALLKSGDIKFRILSGATVGLGTTVSLDTMVNPLVLKVMLWDGFTHYFTTRSYQDRMDRKLDCRVNTVAVNRCGEMAQVTLSMIEKEYIRLAEELWRIPTNANFSHGIYADSIKRSPSVQKNYMQSVQANSREGIEQGVVGLTRSSAVLYGKQVHSKPRNKRAHKPNVGLLAVRPAN